MNALYIYLSSEICVDSLETDHAWTRERQKTAQYVSVNIRNTLISDKEKETRYGFTSE